MKDILSNKKVIVFDGVCALCNKFVLFITNHDRKDIFRFISLQNKKTLLELDKRGFNPKKIESILLIDKSGVKTESSAVLSIFYHLRFPFNLFCILTVFPNFFRNHIYRYIAKNRYKNFGKVSYCSIINENESVKIEKKLIK